MNDIQQTISLIQKLHEGQTDWAGAPYWKHPVAVMNRLPESVSVNTRLIALLHDVIEDCQDNIKAELIAIKPTIVFDDVSNTDIGIYYLRYLGYYEYVVDGVALLTRDPENGMTYIEQIRNIVASGHIGAIMVKLADNGENTSPERFNNLSDANQKKALEMRQRYERSKKILRGSLANRDIDTSWAEEVTNRM
jgi:(p)ppGpp synthase/HD superfamily hydrolase